MLERVALHQTRLRTPGISLDSKGIAIGSKGLVLLPSLDRLVGFLSLYTSSSSLADLMSSLSIDMVRSKLGNREVVMTFAADTSDRMDRVAELARLSGGFTFTGTKRHFVQYRDAAAPFGYDLDHIAPTDATLSLSHCQFTQEYDHERKIDLASLVLRLQPRLAPSSASVAGPQWICAEAGLGDALIHYFIRSLVPAEVGVAEWPPASEFEEVPLRRHLFKLDEIPERMFSLLRDTPGMGVFAPAGPSVAVEQGFQHPINLRGCPVFPPDGLVLIRGRGLPPITVDPLPTLGPVESFARIELRDHQTIDVGRGAVARKVSVPLKLAVDTRPFTAVTATLVSPPELGLLRQLCYRVGRSILATTKIAFTERGAILVRRSGIEGIPVGEFFRQIHPKIFISAGHAPAPAVSAATLHSAFGSPEEVLFLHRDGTRFGLREDLFVSLERALLDAQAWSGLTAERVSSALAVSLPEVVLEAPGLWPMRDVDTASDEP